MIHFLEDVSDSDRESFSSGHASGEGDDSEQDDHDDLCMLLRLITHNHVLNEFISRFCRYLRCRRLLNQRLRQAFMM